MASASGTVRPHQAHRHYGTRHTALARKLGRTVAVHHSWLAADGHRAEVQQSKVKERADSAIQSAEQRQLRRRIWGVGSD